MAKGFGGALSEKSWFEQLIERAVWRDVVAVYDGMIPAADLPGRERESAFAAVDALSRSRMGLLSTKVPKAKEFLPFALRAETGDARLDMLIVAAVAKSFKKTRGIWPQSIEVLRQSGFLTEEEFRRVGSANLAQDRDDLVVVMPLPLPAKDAPPDVRIRLDG